MYLISMYFDMETEKRMKKLIKEVAGRCGNTFMVDNQVPPHITISAFECCDEELSNVIAGLDENIKRLTSGEVYFATVGQFMPGVLYVAPVLNAYLQEVAEAIYDGVRKKPGVNVSKYYRPLQWFPHMTVAKTLTKEEMLAAFAYMQEVWVPIKGTGIKIGLAKTNPYKDFKLWQFS